MYTFHKEQVKWFREEMVFTVPKHPNCADTSGGMGEGGGFYSRKDALETVGVQLYVRKRQRRPICQERA